jgi:hypothetical protein
MVELKRTSPGPDSGRSRLSRDDAKAIKSSVTGVLRSSRAVVSRQHLRRAPAMPLLAAEIA